MCCHVLRCNSLTWCAGEPGGGKESSGVGFPMAEQSLLHIDAGIPDHAQPPRCCNQSQRQPQSPCVESRVPLPGHRSCHTGIETRKRQRVCDQLNGHFCRQPAVLMNTLHVASLSAFPKSRASLQLLMSQESPVTMMGYKSYCANSWA